MLIRECSSSEDQQAAYQPDGARRAYRSESEQATEHERLFGALGSKQRELGVRLAERRERERRGIRCRDPVARSRERARLLFVLRSAHWDAIASCAMQTP